METEEVQDEIIKEMAKLKSQMEKYGYLIRLGRGLAPMDEKLKTADNLIGGCQSRVWLNAELKEGKLRIAADSDALIVKGIIALLLRVLNNRTPQEISGADLYFLRETGLESRLSPVRANGVLTIVSRIKDLSRR